MKQNVSNKFRKNKKVLAIFEFALRVYRLSNFDNQMDELEKINLVAHEYLVKVDIHKWAHVHYPV